MPEQESRRGDVVTTAQFTGPMETQLLRLGVEGLNLKDARDVVPPTQLTRMTNVSHDAGGALTGRLGMTSLHTNIATPHHSIRKFRDPQVGLTAWAIGGGTQLYLGSGGAATLRDTGYSGDPMALTPHRPPLSGDPWLFVGDRSQMRKIRFDGLALPQGLPAPASAPLLTTSERRTDIEGFNPDLWPDFSAPTGDWVPNAGTDFAFPTPNPTDVPPGSDGGTFNIMPTAANLAAETGFFSFWNLEKTLNLDSVGGSPANDQDVIHVKIMFGNPGTVAEVRLYFVCSETFVTTSLPGVGPGNTDFYVKTFRPGDFARFLKPELAQVDAAEIARLNTLRNESLADRGYQDDTRTSWADRRAATDPARSQSLVAGKGADEFVTLGAIGTPLRRGDFLRVGDAEDRDWSVITGIVVYMQANAKATGENFVTFLECYMVGGYGPDSVEPGAQPYDVRYTNYDPRTGAESNGSPVMSAISMVDARRAALTIVPAAYVASGLESPASVRQRIYVRGGSIIDDWYFAGVNTSNGGTFSHTGTDDSITGAGTLAIDHFQPVPTVNDAGTTVLGQPCRAQWGPLEGMLLACGDPYRPGHLYFSLPDAPEHWASDGNVEVCAPSEELMNGGILGSQAFVFSRERLYLLYPNLTGSVGITATPSLCKRGVWAYWAFCVGPDAIYFLAEDGIFKTAGGPEEWLTELIDPLFKGVTVHGYAPVNMAIPSALRLTVHESKLYFCYEDTGGHRRVLVYDLLRSFWRAYTFAIQTSVAQGDDETELLLGTVTNGAVYRHHGTSDHGNPITSVIRTGSLSGGRREEKLFGDQILDMDRADTFISVQNFLNEEAIANGIHQITSGDRDRYILDPFGTSPQIGRSIATEISWATIDPPPTLFQIGYAITAQPEVTIKRVTNWDDLGHPDEKWVTGVTFDCDTSNDVRVILIERDFNGVRDTVATLNVLANGRHKRTFSWDAVPANMVRIRPDSDGNCAGWLLYRADWIWQPEPPRISKWDIHFENAWDVYYTGLDLYCDTSGQEKRIEVSVDGVVIPNFQTGLDYHPVVANGRRVVHLTFVAGRGHVLRFRAIDDFPGLLYTHRWHIQEEPSEQANWNQNFSILGSRADKWLKAVIFECDTFGVGKQVRIEADGATVETLTITANGRSVVQRALSTQQLGRVWRMYPADGNPGRLYSAQPVFDEEPFCLTRWETQEDNHGLPGRFAPLYAQITLKCSLPVTLSVQLQHNQSGHLTTKTYTIPSTGGVKQRRFVPFEAGAGWLVKYVLTSTAAFWLYREESQVVIQPWGAAQPITVPAFGNEGMTTPTRAMIHSELAAGRSGGGTS